MTLNLSLSEIRHVQSAEQAAAVLRCLKNEIVGHIQAKETWVQQGALELVCRILGSRSQQHFAQTRANAPGLADDGLARLQALQVLASFAKGGPSFFGPIHSAGVIPLALSNMSPHENPPRIVLTALHVLNSLAVATRLSASSSDDATALADAVFGPTPIGSLHAILTSESCSSICLEQKSLAMGLIARLCRDPRHQNALANAGILDALGTMLAGFVVSRGEVVPGAEEQSDGMAENIPEAAPRGARLSDTLSALSAIIEDSRFRSCMLLCSPAIMAVFPGLQFTPPTQECHLVWNTLESAGLRSHETKSGVGAMEYLLPAVPNYQSKNSVSTFSSGAPVTRPTSRENSRSALLWDQVTREAQTSNGELHEEAESPMIPWLINLVRSTTGLDRVLAASVLASLVSAGFASSERETTIGRVVVPILCQIMKDHTITKAENTGCPSCVKSSVALDWAITERTPAVLARLIADSEYLQQAAYDSGAAELGCALLKESFEPLETATAPKPWSPNPERRRDIGEGLASQRIGPAGRVPVSAHRMQLRENSLKLIASLLSYKEEFRKAVVEQDVMPYLAECLVPVPGKPKPAKDRSKAEKGGSIEEAVRRHEPSLYGNNPKSVIMAACHVVRSLGRSVSVIRVHLEDFGVATPIFHLLTDADVSLQVAACAAICNLVLEVSPMRTPLIKAGVLGVLCEHAHSPDAGLRLNAMWALKHLLLGAKNDLKKQALKQLGAAWLLQLITADTEDDALHSRMRWRDEVGKADEDEEMDGDGYADDVSWVWPGLARFQSAPVCVQQANKKLIKLREAEMSPLKKARSDDLAIQEQGLNFIRNLIGLPAPAGSGLEEMTEMLDHVFSELGQDRLFDVLAQKLRFKVLRPFDRRRLVPSRSTGSSVNDSRVVYPQAKVVGAVVYILVHMAASIPRHKQLVMTQTDLLKQLASHFSSKDADVRKALCHLMINLSWQESGDDANDCAQRTHELRRLGFLAKLETLEQTDHELDVRERAREAADQLKIPPPL